MNFRKEKTDQYQLFGKNDIIIPIKHSQALDFILDYGNKVVEDGTHDSINIAAGFLVGDGYQFHLLHGIYFNDNDDNTHFMYGWEIPEGGVDECFTVIDVPQTTWAVFTYSGEHKECLPHIWTYLYSNWFFSSGYETGNNIIIEKESWVGDEFFAEVWIPIKEK